jgi:hypothetical protein
VIKVPAIVAVQLRALNAVEFAKRPAAPPKRPRRKPTQPQAQALPVTIAVEAPPADEPSPEPPAPEPPAPVVDDEALDDSTYRD